MATVHAIIIIIITMHFSAVLFGSQNKERLNKIHQIWILGLTWALLGKLFGVDDCFISIPCDSSIVCECKYFSPLCALLPWVLKCLCLLCPRCCFCSRSGLGPTVRQGMNAHYRCPPFLPEDCRPHGVDQREVLSPDESLSSAKLPLFSHSLYCLFCSL